MSTLRGAFVGIAASAAILSLAIPSSANAVTARTVRPAWRTGELAAPGGRQVYTAMPMAVSCSAPGYCAAGGYAETYAYKTSAIVALDTRGHWTRFSYLQLPANAEPGNPPDQGTQVSAVSCPSRNFCVAVGDYLATGGYSGVPTGFMTTESRGKWAAATALPLPASLAGNPAALDSVSCPSVTYCAAAGTTGTSPGAIVPVTVTYSRGEWQQPVKDPPLRASMARGQMQTISMSCVGPGNCVAVGALYGTGTYPDIGLQWIESHGRWGLPAIASAPADADEPGTYLTSVSCTMLTSCIAVGYYDRRGSSTAMEVIRSHGHWKRGLTANVGRTSTTLNAVSCTSTLCVAVGKYHAFLRSLAVSEQHAKLFSDPVNIPLPPNAMPAEPNNEQFTALTAVSCLRTGWCAAVGSYIDKADNPAPMVSVRS